MSPVAPRGFICDEDQSCESFCVAGTAFGDVAVSLFVAGAIFGDVAVPLLVARTAFGDVGVSLFVASAVFGEIWLDSRIAKCCNLHYKMRCRGRKVSSANGRVQFCNFMLVSWPDHGRIVRAL